MKKTSLYIAAGVALATQLATAGEITGIITLKGKAPAESALTTLKADPTCGKLHSSTPMTHFYVVGAKGELADVVVSVEGLSGKGSPGASATPAVLDQKGCEYIPSILAVQTDQKITIKNSDPCTHNVHALPATPGNNEKNLAQPQGAPNLTYSFAKAENFLKFECNIHPWMRTWVSVFDHPYFAVSGKDGTFKISNVPAGKYTIQAFHRKAGKVSRQVEVKEGTAAKLELALDAK